MYRLVRTAGGSPSRRAVIVDPVHAVPSHRCRHTVERPTIATRRSRTHAKEVH